MRWVERDMAGRREGGEKSLFGFDAVEFHMQKKCTCILY